jgi:alkyldihydroxyacetonephosphate synthase
MLFFTRLAARDVLMVDEATLNRIRAAVGLDGVSYLPTDLTLYSRDLWPRMTLQMAGNRMPDSEPLVVAWPRTTEAVQAAMRVCADAGLPVVPFGGGSGVCGGAVPPRGGVVLDLKRMNRLISLDRALMTVTVEAGMIGQHLEDALNECGFTLGHFPSSIMCSTVGGWVATRSAGQYSTRYGKIEDMVLGVEAVLADGSLVAVDASRGHAGSPDWLQMFVGSEGTLGAIVRVRLRVHTAPVSRAFGAFRFVDLAAGLEAMRSLMQGGLRPSVMRLYDPLDTFVNGLSFSAGSEERRSSTLTELRRLVLGEDSGSLTAAAEGPLMRQFLAHPWVVQSAMDLLPLTCVLIVGFEGEPGRPMEDLARASELARRATGVDLGSGPGEHWYRKRYAVSFKLVKVFGAGAFAETIEVSSPWRDVQRVYESVRAALKPNVLAMAHFSHAYRSGCAAYFTLSGSASTPRAMLDLYDRSIRLAIGSAMKNGASVSHHHGVGTLKRSWTPEEYRGGDRLFWALKSAVDPQGILNPGKVYPPPGRTETSGGEEAKEGEDEPLEFGSVVSYNYNVRSSSHVTPQVPEEVQEILRLAHRSGTRITCQSDGAGQRPQAGEGVCRLDLSGLDNILEMDPVSGMVTVQAGMRMDQLQSYLIQKGFTLGHLGRSRRKLMVGDYLATVMPYEGSPRYGTLLDSCLGLSGFLADGTPFSARPCPRRAGGPDFMHALIGAAGRYGVITAACLQVYPKPSVMEAVAYGTDDATAAVSAVRIALAREARPVWALVVLRSPSMLGKCRRTRLVFQFAGSREEVSAGLSVVRGVVEPLRMEPEAVRTETPFTPEPKRLPSLERFLGLDDVIRLVQTLTGECKRSNPEVHVTDFAVHGATFRMLRREETQSFPQELVDALRDPGLPSALAVAADRMKSVLDPEGILNPPVSKEVGDAR